MIVDITHHQYTHYSLPLHLQFVTITPVTRYRRTSGSPHLIPITI